MRIVNTLVASVLFVAAFSIWGCTPSPYYQKDVAIPQNAWNYNYKPSFKFDITDTAALYKLYFIVRHTEAYPFSNIWLVIHSKNPGDSTFERVRLEIPLAEPGGKWLGRGMGTIWEQRMPLTDQRFKKPGTYEIMLEQTMRVNPLPELLQIGLRVEKVGHFKNQKQPS